MTELDGLVAHAFRREHAHLVSTLTRRYGLARLAAVEDAVQAALLTALSAWALRGVPADRRGWLYRVADNQLRDGLRRSSAEARATERAAVLEAELIEAEDPRLDAEIHDAELRMLFVVCHDALPAETRLVLALKTLCGFSTAEIGQRLYMTEANVHKRLARGRDKLRELAPELDTPPTEQLTARLNDVLTVIYLLLNEGFLSTRADEPIRRELCEEALRLARWIVLYPSTDQPEARALLALCCFHCARLDARQDDSGALLVLEEQDRSRWDRRLIQEGSHWLGRSAEGDRFSRYHAEAAIAAEHCQAPSFEATRWGEIAELYLLLEAVAPSPMHRIGRAVAVARAGAPESALRLLDELSGGPFDDHYLHLATRADLLARLERSSEARATLVRAAEQAATPAEQALLLRRLSAMG